MWEYPIARAYADARVIKIAGGSIEIMKTIIAKRMFAEKHPLRSVVYFPLSSRFSTLPVGVIGKASMKSIDFGTL
jgi:hypothetical protein